MQGFLDGDGGHALGRQDHQHVGQDLRAECLVLGPRIFRRMVDDAADAGHGQHDGRAYGRKADGIVSTDRVEVARAGTARLCGALGQPDQARSMRPAARLSMERTS